MHSVSGGAPVFCSRDSGATCIRLYELASKPTGTYHNSKGHNSSNELRNVPILGKYRSFDPHTHLTVMPTPFGRTRSLPAAPPTRDDLSNSRTLLRTGDGCGL